MGELDAVVAPNHRCANKETGAAHSCGHHAQIASMVGAAYAFKDTGILEELGGDVVLMAVPAEEYVELGYRNELRKAGKIWFLGGKQEFVRLGPYDDIDICVMQHTELGNVINCGQKYNGFVGKLVQYIGKEAHAGGAPHLGINAPQRRPDRSDGCQRQPGDLPGQGSDPRPSHHHQRAATWSTWSPPTSASRPMSAATTSPPSWTAALKSPSLQSRRRRSGRPVRSHRAAWLYALRGQQRAG